MDADSKLARLPSPAHRGNTHNNAQYSSGTEPHLPTEHKPPLQGSSNDQLVLAAIEALLLERQVPLLQRSAVLAAAKEQLALRLDGTRRRQAHPSREAPDVARAPTLDR